jgi:muconolactone delta-isomerase
MKYLILSQRNAVPIPPGQVVALFQAAKLWLKASQAEGRLDCYYAFADTRGTFAITNADSHEEVWDGILDYPLYMFFDWEVEPLCDPDHALDKLIDVADKIFG